MVKKHLGLPALTSQVSPPPPPPFQGCTSIGVLRREPLSKNLWCAAHARLRMAVPRRTGRLTFWVLQGFSCLLMKHFQLKPLVSKDFAIAKCRSTTERNGQHQLSVICRSRCRNDSQYHHFFCISFRQKKTPFLGVPASKNSGFFGPFSGFPTSFFGSKFFPPGMALLGWKWLQYCTIPLPRLPTKNSRSHWKSLVSFLVVLNWHSLWKIPWSSVIWLEFWIKHMSETDWISRIWGSQ